MCAAPLTRAATGRPPLYCSVACRRAAEYAIRRLDRHLFDLETDRVRLRRLEGPGYPIGREMAVIDAAIAEADARLRTLLGRLSPGPKESRQSV